MISFSCLPVVSYIWINQIKSCLDLIIKANFRCERKVKIECCHYYLPPVFPAANIHPQEKVKEFTALCECVSVNESESVSSVQPFEMQTSHHSY